MTQKEMTQLGQNIEKKTNQSDYFLLTDTNLSKTVGLAFHILNLFPIHLSVQFSYPRTLYSFCTQ